MVWSLPASAEPLLILRVEVSNEDVGFILSAAPLLNQAVMCQIVSVTQHCWSPHTVKWTLKYRQFEFRQAISALSLTSDITKAQKTKMLLAAPSLHALPGHFQPVQYNHVFFYCFCSNCHLPKEQRDSQLGTLLMGEQSH